MTFKAKLLAIFLILLIGIQGQNSGQDKEQLEEILNELQKNKEQLNSQEEILESLQNQRKNSQSQQQEISVDGIPEELEFDEYENKINIFRNALETKFEMKIPYEINHMEILSLKTSRSSTDPLISYMIFAIADNHKLVFIDVMGRVQKVKELPTQIYKYTFLNQADENLIVILTRDGFVHQFVFDLQDYQQQKNESFFVFLSRPPPLPPHSTNSERFEIFQDEDSNSNKYTNRKKYDIRNFYLSEVPGFELPLKTENNENQNIEEYVTSLGGFYSKSVKIILIGNSEGQITAHHLNDTLISKATVGTGPISDIILHYPYPIFTTGRSFGFYNPFNKKIQQPVCEQPPDDILAVLTESPHSQQIFVLLKSFEVYIYEIKTQKQTCSIIFKLNSGEQDLFKDGQKLLMNIFQNYLIIYTPNNQIAKFVNVTNYKNKQMDILDDPGFYWKGFYDHDEVKIDESKLVISYSSKRHSTTISYNVYGQYDGTSTQIVMNQLTQESSDFSFNFLENFRFPMILVAILVLFLVKYWKKSGSVDEADNKFSKEKIDELINQMQQSEQAKNSHQQSSIHDSSIDSNHPF